MELGTGSTLMMQRCTINDCMTYMLLRLKNLYNLKKNVNLNVNEILALVEAEPNDPLEEGGVLLLRLKLGSRRNIPSRRPNRLAPSPARLQSLVLSQERLKGTQVDLACEKRPYGLVCKDVYVERFLALLGLLSLKLVPHGRSF